jgi:hypothetical protein
MIDAYRQWILDDLLADDEVGELVDVEDSS